MTDEKAERRCCLRRNSLLLFKTDTKPPAAMAVNVARGLLYTKIPKRALRVVRRFCARVIYLGCKCRSVMCDLQIKKNAYPNLAFIDSNACIK